jgi:hypothetical protein
MVADAITHANSEKQSKVKKFVELITTLTDELVARARQLGILFIGYL